MGSTPSCSSARPTWGRTAAVDLARLGCAEVMRPAVGEEAHRQAVLDKDLLERPEGRGRALLLDEKRRMDRPGRVIQRDTEIKRRLALEPCVARAVPRLRGGRLWCSIMPGSGRRSRLRRCAPLRGAFGATPDHCRCSLSQA